MNTIILTNNTIKYIEILEYKIKNIKNIHIEFLCSTTEDAKNNYFILKSEIQNNIQIIDKNFLYDLNVQLKECYFENNIIIIEGWL